ncbi:MAG: amidohydrolase family protein, partial [Candidatus Binatia bacterium]
MELRTSLDKGYISADSHVVEPPDLWMTRMEQRFRDRAPHYESWTDGDFFCVEGIPPFPSVGFLGAWANDKIAGEGQVTRLLHRKEEIRPGGWDPQARLADLELDHVRAEVLYPGTGLILFATPDPEYQRDCMRVYNDWLIDFCATDPKRFVGAAMLPTRGPIEWAVQEAERTAKQGLRSVMVPCGNPEKAYHDRYYEPLWSALQEMQLPVALHPGGDEQSPAATFGKGVPINAWVIENKIVPMERTLAGLLASGVSQKYPDLQFVIVEGGIGWIASV